MRVKHEVFGDINLFAYLSSSEDEEESSCFLHFFLSFILFRLLVAGRKRGRLFGKSDNFATENQFMTDDVTSGAGNSIVWAIRWVSGLELATHGTLKWLKRGLSGRLRMMLQPR